MQEEKNENLIDFKKWTTDFCTSLQSHSSEISLFAAQFDTFIEQVIELCELNPPNQDSTTYFLDESIPSVIKAIFTNQSSIQDAEIKQAFVFIITNLTVLFQWLFSSDYIQLYHCFFPVFSEDSEIYKRNNGGQQPSKMWCDSMKKFIDLSTFQLLILRFEEEGTQIDHFYTCFQVFASLMPALDIKPTIELGAQIFQYFQNFLNELTTDNFGEKITSIEILSKSITSIYNIITNIHDKTAFLNGFNSFLHLLQVLVAINNDEVVHLALYLIDFLIKLESKEVNNQLKEFVLQVNLLHSIQKIPTSILELVINDISVKDLLAFLNSLSEFNNTEKSLALLEPEKMQELIDEIPEDNTKLPPLLINASFLAKSTNPKLTETILLGSFNKFNLSNIAASKFAPLYDQFQALLTDICTAHLNESSNDINLSLILNIFCEIVKRKPSILNDDILRIVYTNIVEEGNVALFPILDKAYVNSKRQMNEEQVEMLFKCSDHKPIWTLFNNMIKARGSGAFEYDISTSIFYNFNENDKAKDNSQKNLLTNDDLSDPLYIEFIVNYVLVINMKNKTIQTLSKFTGWFGSTSSGWKSTTPTWSSTTSAWKSTTSTTSAWGLKTSTNTQQGSTSNTTTTNATTSNTNTTNKNTYSISNWIPQQFKVIEWPLLYFDNLMQLVIFNETEMISKSKGDSNTQQAQNASPLINNIAHTEVYKKLFNMLKNIDAQLMKKIIQTFIGLLSAQTQDSSFFVILTYLFEFVQNTESSKCLRDYGIVQHYALNVPIESDLPNEVNVTYENNTKTVKYDPQLPLGELLRSAALKFGSTKDNLVLRNKDNKMLSNQTLPNPDSEGYKMTGRLNPIKQDEFPSYILSDENVSFNSFLLTKLMDDLSPETEKLIEAFLEYLPTDLQIQDLVFNTDDFIESLKSQTKPYPYFYMIKAAIHRSRSKELVSNYRKSDIFNVVKSDYLNSKFEHKNDHLLLSFLCCFFNDDKIDTDIIARLVEELRNIKNYCGDNKKTMELMAYYAGLSKSIKEKTQKNPLADYLIENNLVEPLITTCHDNVKQSMSKFIASIIPGQNIYDLFLKDPGNSKIDEVFLSSFEEFIKEKDEKEKDQIITDLIEKFTIFNDQVLKRCISIILSKDIVKKEYVEKMLDASMVIVKEPLRSITLNTVVDFCMGDLKPIQQTLTTLQRLQQQQQQPTNQNRGIVVPDTEYKKCIYDFLEKITKIHFVGNDLYIPNPIRSNFEYVRQELFHLKPIRDYLLNPENHDYFVGNESAHDLQTYFSKMILNIPPQYLYVKGNTRSPYKHLVNLVTKIFPPEIRDDLVTFVPSQCIVDTSIFETLEKATPSIIVHLTHYTPSNIPLDIKVKGENYNLTGFIVKQKSFFDPAFANPMAAPTANEGQNGGERLIPQKHSYRTIVLEGGSWLIYQDQFINRMDEGMLYPIFQAEFENADPNALKPYILFYTQEKIINKFTIDFNESPVINYSMLHFQGKDELPQDILIEIEQAKAKTNIESFSISNTCASLFERRADPALLFTYYTNIYCRSASNSYSTQFRNILLAEGGNNLPSLDLIISLIEPLCVSFKQMTQIIFIDTLTLIISEAIKRNVTPDYKDAENMKNYQKVLKIIEKIAEIFPQLEYNFATQNKVSRIFHSFILSTNTYLKSDDNNNDDQSEIDSFSVCLSLNIPSMLFESICSNFSKTRSVNYINMMDASDIIHCITCFVEMLGDSLHDLLVHVSQIQASNVNNFYLIMLVMKCVKYNAFTLDELKGVSNDPEVFFSNSNIVNTLITGITTFSTDKELAELSDIFYNDDILIYFLDRLILHIASNKQLMQKMIQISSIFCLNLFLHDNKQVKIKTYMLAAKLVDNEDNFTDFTIKLADNFNSELSLLLINRIITTTICDHQLIARHLLKRASQVNFVKNETNNNDDEGSNNALDETADSTDIFASVSYDNEDDGYDDDNNNYQDKNSYSNAFFNVLENLSIKDIDQYIPFIITKLSNVDNLRFFIKNFDKEILSQFEKNEKFVIPRISIYKNSLMKSSTIEIDSKVPKAKLSKLKGYELVSEFINCILGIDPQSPIIKRIIINEKRGYVPYEFVQFIPAISTATDENEVETFLPPKILCSSLNYSIAKANINETNENDDKCLVGVQYFLHILLKHNKEYDFSRLFLNIPEVCTFTSKFGKTKTSHELMKLIKMIINQNKVFREMLEDEIETQLKRNSEVPNFDVMKMEIELDLDLENVKNNKDNVVDKIVEIHKAAVQRSISRSPSIELNSSIPKLDTSEYLFSFYLSENFEKTPVAFMIFPVSLLSSKVEKQFFSSAFSDLSDDDYLKFCKDSMKKSKTLSQITFDQLDMKRIWFLMKLKPNLTENIKKLIPVDRRRVIMMLKLMPDGQKYAMKVFNIKDEEIGINTNTNNNDNDASSSTTNNESVPRASHEIQREAMSVPNLDRTHDASQRPPPANSTNYSDNNNSSNNSKPYFFQRPKMHKKP